MTDRGRQHTRINLAIWGVIVIACLMAVSAGMAASAELGIAPASLVLVMALLPIVVAVALGIIVRREDHKIYLRSDRSLSPPWSGMGGAAGALPSAALFGLAGILYVLGFDGLAYLLGWLSGIVVAAIAIGPRLAASGASTVPEYFGARFGASMRIAAALILALVCLLVLTAEISLAGSVVSRAIDVPRWLGVAAVATLIVLAVAGGGMQALTRFQVPLYIVLAVGFLAALGWFALATRGVALPQLSYGEALAEITRLETHMIEKGLADLRSFQPHVKPFLQIDRLNFFAITLTVMAGAAALPHIAGRYLSVPSAREARLSGAWTALFLLLLLVTAPAYAAFAKVEVYTLIAAETPPASLPAWIEGLSRADLVRIHGTSMKLLENVVGATKAGASDVAAVGAYLNTHGLDATSGWLDLKPQARTAILEAARMLGDAPASAQWETYRQTVLPAAALAAGNKTGFITHGGFVMESAAVMPMIAQISGAPLMLTGLLAAAFASALIATTSGLSMSLAGALGRDFLPETLSGPESSKGLWVLRAALAIALAVAAAFAIAAPPDPMAAIMLALSLAASALLPALLLGLWWRRASAWGLFAGMLVGLAVALYYSVGTRYWPVSFYETWPHLSNASEAAIRKLVSLKSAWSSAAEGDAKRAAWAALEAHARGSGIKLGPANWFGVHGSASALFALPAAFLAAVVVSHFTHSRRASSAHA